MHDERDIFWVAHPEKESLHGATSVLQLFKTSLQIEFRKPRNETRLANQY